MLDIGSIFPLYDKDIECTAAPVEDDARHYYYALCREILLDIAIHNADSNQCVLVPEYTCSTVTEPFLQLQWKVVTYKINKLLRIDTADFAEKVGKEHPSVVIVHPYYGQDLNDTELKCIQETKKQGFKLVMDITQCLYTKQYIDFAEYYVTSLYKWYPLVDGSVLETKEDFVSEKQESSNYVARQKEAMYLRGCYFEKESNYVKDISRRINKEAIAMNHTGLVAHSMSEFSRKLYRMADATTVSERRMENGDFLHRHILFNEKIQQVIAQIDSAPIYYPIYCYDQLYVQKVLAAQQIYAPILWPIDPNIKISDDSMWIYTHLLALPVDQRYSPQDLQRITDLLNNL